MLDARPLHANAYRQLKLYQALKKRLDVVAQIPLYFPQGFQSSASDKSIDSKIDV